MAYAARLGHNEVIKALAAANVDINDGWRVQQTALQEAASSGLVETVKLLLDLQADTTIGKESGNTALDIAKWNGFKDIVILLENAESEAPRTDESSFAIKTASTEPVISNASTLTTHPSSRVDHNGIFNTTEIHPGSTCPPRCSLEILFAIPYPAPPSLVVGLNEIATSCRDNIRIKTYVDEVHCGRFRIHIDSWAGSRLYSAGSTWFTVMEGDEEYQYGSFNTLEDHAWDEPQMRTTRSIKFARPYDSPPAIVVWLNSLDMFRIYGWRVRASATDISSTGFSLHIDSLGDTQLFGAGASWIAYPAGKVGVVSGTCRTEAITPQLRPSEQGIIGDGGEAKFMSGFNAVPQVFIAFNMLSVSWREFMKVNVTVDSINKVGMTWHINAWDGTRLDAAEASYIAIC